jgi:hypothetical protein
MTELDFDTWEYYDLQDPTNEELAESLNEGFVCISTKVVKALRQDNGETVKITNKLMRRRVQTVEEGN